MERQADWDKIIIGIDPGTNVMGYGILGVRQRKPELIAMGVIMLSKFDDRYMRLRRIAERVTGLVEQYLPDEMALEACGTGIIWGTCHERIFSGGGTFETS